MPKDNEEIEDIVDLPGDGEEVQGMVGDSIGGDTMEVEDKAGAEGTEGDVGAEGAEGDVGAEGAEDPNAALMDQLAALQQQNTTLQEQLTATNSDNEKLEEENSSILDLEHNDLVAMVTENPHGFVQSVFDEVKAGVMSQVNQDNEQNKQNGAIEDTIGTYADDNPDFEELWEDGSIKGFMDKNPGHNAMSAHMMLVNAGRVAAAKKEGADEAAKNFTTKMGSQTLGSSVAIPPNKSDAAVKNTKKYGGRARVAAARAGLI